MKTIKDIPYGSLPEQKLDILLPECDEFSVLLYFHGTHCAQDNSLDENGESVLGKIAYDLISYVENK